MMASPDLNIYYQNTRGLRTKTHLFKRNLLLNSYDIISLTETWLLDGINDSELFDSRYVVWRRDRNYQTTREKYGGGVLLALRREFSAVYRPEWSSPAEDIWVSVTFTNKNNITRTIHICTVYLCSENLGYSYNAQVCNFTDKLSQIVNSHPDDLFMILGDFNFSNIKWTFKYNDCPKYSGLVGQSQTYFFDTLSECNLVQYNNHYNQNDRILDLVLSNIDLLISTCAEPLVPEDVHHKSLVINLKNVRSDPLLEKPRLKYFFESGDYEKIESYINSVDWDACLLKTTLEEAVQNFYNLIYEVINRYIPHKLVSITNFPPWFNASLKKVLKEKFKYLKKFHKYGNTADYDSFSLLRHRAKVLEETCYATYIKNCEESIIKNPKLFWSFIKSNKKGPNNIPSSMSYLTETADKGENICHLFANYFQSNFLPSSNIYTSTSPLLSQNHWNTNVISDIEIVPDTITKLLKSLDLTKGAGPDRIPPLFIVKCSESLTKPLSILYSRSVAEGIIPAIWKSAFISPIFKNGNRNEIKNYRPISKLCIFAKILEKIVYSQVYSSVSSSFIPEQHGFLKKRSTTSNLLTFVEYVTLNMDSGAQVDSIFTDFSKCFDRIDHYILLQKLSYAGIHGNLFRWLKAYIENRSQAVVLNGYTSAWHFVPSGVPQGSLLGPLLFNIFINDVSSCFLNSKFLLYADDMKIFKNVNDINDCLSLQEDLDRFQNYCNLNRLELNVVKCFALTFSRKTNNIKYQYHLLGHQLKFVDEIRDLGVIHDKKLTYEKHIDMIANKANRSMGFIVRQSSLFKSVKVIKILYCSYVRSILEYCSQVWNPQYQVHKDRIESIQRKLLKRIQYKCNTTDDNYELRCKRHHMLPLYERRKIADIVILQKIAQGQLDSHYLLQAINLRVPKRSYTRNPYSYLYSASCSTKYRKNSFTIRSASFINKLVDIPDFDLFNMTVPALKHKMTKNWFDKI